MQSRASSAPVAAKGTMAPERSEAKSVWRGSFQCAPAGSARWERDHTTRGLSYPPRNFPSRLCLQERSHDRS